MTDKRCTFTNGGKWHCGSYAFNLSRDGIKQGPYCDVHYWQNRCEKAENTSIAQSVSPTPQSMQEYGDARVQAYKTARQAEQGSPPAWMQNIDVAMQEPLFQALRGMMGTENIGQDIALLQTIRHYRAHTQHVQPVSVLEQQNQQLREQNAELDRRCAEYEAAHGIGAKP